MRALAIAIIVGVAGFIFYTVLGRDCDGSIVANEQQCAGTTGFDRAFCNAAFGRAEDAILRAGNVFKSQQECQVRFLNCIEFPGIHGWTPRPKGYCIARDANGALARMTPVYDRPR